MALWTGILNAVGTGTCSGANPTACAIDWSTAGIPGGIPSGSWTQSGTTILAATAPCSNGTGDCTATIQAALNTCAGTSKFVLLGPGTFRLNGVLTIPSKCALRGSGANQTILSIFSTTANAAIRLGAENALVANDVKITSGATAGSTSIVVSSTAGISVGSLLIIRQYNDPTRVTTAGDPGGGVCTFCNVLFDNANNSNRVLGQTNKVTAISGTTLTLADPIYVNMNQTLPNWAAGTAYAYDVHITNGGHIYEQTNQPASPFICTSGSSTPAFSTSGGTVSDGSCSWKDLGVGTTAVPVACPTTPTVSAGLENLQIFANNTNAGANWSMTECDSCWVSGTAGNYTDGDHGDVVHGYHDQIEKNYFSNAYLHTSGTFDSDVSIKYGSSGCLVQNNIFERLHVSVMLGEGASGNVIAYNYGLGNFDNGAPNVMVPNLDLHEAHPQLNLYEGNTWGSSSQDSTWGGSGNNTSFREWLTGATFICNPLSGRGTVVCSPQGPQGNAGINGWFAVQAVRDHQLHYQTYSYNLVGGVVGSAQQEAITSYNNGTTLLPVVPQAVAVCGPSPCGAGSLGYDTATYELALGYGNTSDPGGTAFDSIVPFNTLFQHGQYSYHNNTVTWSGSITHTLPASMYLTSKPSWFGSVPFPPIGPDVTGGVSGARGFAYAIPAQVCYQSVMGGTNGAGSPLSFNAAACYASAPAGPINAAITGHASVSGSLHAGPIRAAISGHATVSATPSPTGTFPQLNAHNHTDNGNTSSTTVSTLLTGVRAGDIIIAEVSSDNGSGTPVVNDNVNTGNYLAANTYHLNATLSQNGGIFYYRVSKAGNITVKATCATSKPFLCISAQSFTPAAGQSFNPDPTMNKQQDGSTANPIVGTAVTPAANNEVIIGFLVNNNTPTAGANFTLIDGNTTTLAWPEYWIQGTKTATNAPYVAAASAWTDQMVGFTSSVSGSTASAAGHATVSGNLKAKGKLAAAVSGHASVSATLKGAGLRTASITGHATVSGNLHSTAHVIATINGHTTVVANNRATGRLVAAINGHATVSGNLKGTGRLAGAIAAHANVSGQLRGQAQAAASITGKASVAADATGSHGLLASVISDNVNITANLKGSGKLVDSVTGRATVSGGLQGLGRLAGSVSGHATVSGTLTGLGRRNAAISGHATTGAFLQATGVLHSAISGHAVVNGATHGTGVLASTVSGHAEVSGTLKATGILAGSASGHASVLASPTGSNAALAAVRPINAQVSGVLTGTGVLAADISGQAQVSGNQQALTLVGHISGHATVSGTLNPISFPSAHIGGQTNILATLQGKFGNIQAAITGHASVSSEVIEPQLILGHATVIGFLESLTPPSRVVASFDHVSFQRYSDIIFYQPSTLVFGFPTQTTIPPRFISPVEGTADGFGLLGNYALPNQLLLLPANAQVYGRNYQVEAEGFIIAPLESSGQFNIILKQNYFSSLGSTPEAIQVLSDVLCQMTNPVTLPAGSLSGWALKCHLGGGFGSVTGACTIYINGTAYTSAGFSSPGGTTGPIVQLNLSGQLVSNLVSGDQAEMRLTKFDVIDINA